jgi:hypothetical protein
VKRRSLMLVAIVSLLAMIGGTSFAEEQQVPASTTLVLLPGAMKGIGSYGPIGYWRLCAPHSIALNEWQVGFIERLLKPRDSQKELLNKLLSASSTARSAISSSCPEEEIETGPVQMAVIERRINGLLNAFKIVREPYEAFYASLDKSQKALLDALGPARHGWR